MAKTPTKTGNPQAKAARKKRLTADEKAALGDNGELTPNVKGGSLFETQKITAKVKELANEYRDLSVRKSKSLGRFNGARDSLVEAMEADDIERVLIEIGGVRKWVVCEHSGSLKLETVKDDVGDAD